MLNKKCIEKLIEMLKEQKIKVEFTKKNGELRIMNCTKNIPLMQKVNPEFTLSTSDKPKVINEEIIVVYDIDKLGYRSFRKDSIISYSTELYKIGNN